MLRPIDRRAFIRGAGVALALPWLDSMDNVHAGKPMRHPHRFVAIGTPFGFDPPALIPTTPGRDYAITPHLQTIESFRNDFTVISGLSHPNTASASHTSEPVLLTGAPYPGSPTFRNSISVDQVVAEHFRGQTRFDSLSLSTVHGSLSFTRTGVELPAATSPSAVFAQLFLDNKPGQAEAELRRIDEGRSTLDAVGAQARRLRGRVGTADRHRLDEYFEAVRDVERQMEMAQEWVHRPKPKVSATAPSDINTPGQQAARLKLMFDVIHLALVTDSTRSITIKTFGEHHDQSHHGKEPMKLEECRRTETDLMRAYGGLLAKLKESKEEGTNLLDRTAVFLGSNLRDGNTHWTDNLPVVLAGGGFRHGQHLAFSPVFLADLSAKEHGSATPTLKTNSSDRPPPLCNVYLSILQRMGIATDSFGSSSSTLTGLVSA